MIPPCPDCAGEGIDHADGCPGGAAMDRRTDADRDWFSDHPGRDEFLREAEPGDFGLAALEGARLTGWVHVRQVVDGFRIRTFECVRLVPLSSTPSPSVAYLLARFRSGDQR